MLIFPSRVAVSCVSMGDLGSDEWCADILCGRRPGLLEGCLGLLEGCLWKHACAEIGMQHMFSCTTPHDNAVKFVNKNVNVVVGFLQCPVAIVVVLG